MLKRRLQPSRNEISLLITLKSFSALPSCSRLSEMPLSGSLVKVIAYVRMA